jgi:hypothetical protein
MFTENSDGKSGLDNAIDKVFTEMSGESSDSEEYSKMVEQLVRLYSLKPKSKRVSPDTLAIVLGNLLGVLIIVGYERAHIMTSKATNFVLKSPVQY